MGFSRPPFLSSSFQFKCSIGRKYFSNVGIRTAKPWCWKQLFTNWATTTGKGSKTYIVTRIVFLQNMSLIRPRLRLTWSKTQWCCAAFQPRQRTRWRRSGWHCRCSPMKIQTWGDSNPAPSSTWSRGWPEPTRRRRRAGVQRSGFSDFPEKGWWRHEMVKYFD